MKRRVAGGNNAPEADASKRSHSNSDNDFALAVSMLQSAAAAAKESDNSSSSPSEPHPGYVASFLRNSVSPEHARATPAGEPSEVVVVCETFSCAGGTLSADGTFQSCSKRPTNFKTKHHGRGVVCTVHHAFIKCQSCTLHVHEGCFVPSSHGYTIPGFKWTCQRCTLHPPSVQLKHELSECTPKCTPDSGEGREASKSIGSKCLFDTRQHLLDHTRLCGWQIRSSNGVRLYFSCAKGSCTLTFKAKGKEQDCEGEWIATDMPSEHPCCKSGFGSFKAVATAMTTRVCNLPRDAFNDIQRLACCKAFLTVSIQTYIKHVYNGLLVDTSLIYNIGYRARQKLGISEMDKLYSQQEVTVYTSPSFCTSTTIAGSTSARRHLRTRVSRGSRWCLAAEVSLCIFVAQCTLTHFTCTSSGFRITCTYSSNISTICYAMVHTDSPSTDGSLCPSVF